MSLTAAGISTFETLAHGREEVKRASIREHAVRWSSLTLMHFTKDFWTVNDVTKRPWIFWPHLTPLPSPREGILISCRQIRFDNVWCLNLCKVKCSSSYTLYYSNHLAHRLPMQTQRVVWDIIDLWEPTSSELPYTNSEWRGHIHIHTGIPVSSDNKRCLFYLHALDKKGGIVAHKVGMVIVYIMHRTWQWRCFSKLPPCLSIHCPQRWSKFIKK